MKASDLSLRDKVLQTVVLRLNSGREATITHFSPVHLATYEEEIAPRENVKRPFRD